MLIQILNGKWLKPKVPLLGIYTRENLVRKSSQVCAKISTAGMAAMAKDQKKLSVYQYWDD